ncbi:Yip1-domain-containing protein, partial [Coprinellus micaceus]
IPIRTPLTASSQFIQADDDDDLDDDNIPGFTHPALAQAPKTPLDKGKSAARYEPEQLAAPTGNLRGEGSSNLSGNIGSSSQGPQRGPNRQTLGGVQVETRRVCEKSMPLEPIVLKHYLRRYSGVDTLDEPVTTTIARDLFSIYTKLIQVLYPRRSAGREVLRDWDLWGPLILCLTLGIMLSVNAPPSQSLGVFTSVIVICSLGALIVTVQAKLLGGRVSFFQGLCVLGYCIAPLNIAALISCFVHIIYVRAPIALLAWAWCIWGAYPQELMRFFSLASVNFLDGTKIEQQRILLAVYPLLLFYFILAWMILIQ